MPFISQVAVGTREFLLVYGNDYDTKDGTGNDIQIFLQQGLQENTVVNS